MMGSITFLEQACKHFASGSGHDVNVLAVYIISMRFGGDSAKLVNGVYLRIFLGVG